MKLKKSLLIVPALGTLLLAAAGSVGGTVAWFSANTTYDATAGQFAVGALDGNLSVALTNIHGTTCNTGTRTVTVADGDYLADASFNITSGVLYTDTGNSSGVATGFKVLDTMSAAGAITDANWYAKENFTGTSDMHWAVAWKMAFTYTMPTTGIQQNLYFDNKASGGTHNDAQEAAYHTYKGFRLAFFPLTSTNATPVGRIWAPFLASNTTASSVTYVSGTGAANTTACTSANLILPAGEAALAPAKDAEYSNSTASNYLGSFAAGHPNTDITMNIACVAWYEGTDANVVSDAVKSIVDDLAMYFYVLPNS